jgi:hypothetical protein
MAIVAGGLPAVDEPANGATTRSMRYAAPRRPLLRTASRTPSPLVT